MRRSVRRSVCRRARVLGKVACGWDLKSEEHHFLELERGLEGAELPLTWCHIDVGHMLESWFQLHFRVIRRVP